jgi:CBS domain-containing membrane protein
MGSFSYIFGTFNQSQQNAPFICTNSLRGQFLSLKAISNETLWPSSFLKNSFGQWREKRRVVFLSLFLSQEKIDVFLFRHGACSFVDLSQAVSLPGKQLLQFERFFFIFKEVSMSIDVKDIMIQDLFTAHCDESLASVYRTMIENKIRHLPVVNDAKKLVGIISERDIERAMISFVAQDEAGRRLEDCEFPTGQTAGDYMTTSVISLPQDSKITAAIRLMRRKKISSLLCLQNNKVRGIITTDDLLKLLEILVDESDKLKEEESSLARFFDDSWMTAGTATA